MPIDPQHPAIAALDQLAQEHYNQGYATGEKVGFEKGRKVGAEAVLAVLPERLQEFMVQLLEELVPVPQGPPKPDVKLPPETPIEVLKLPARTHRVLMHNGIYSIGEATRVRTEQAKQQWQLNATALAQLDAALGVHGYSREHPVPLLKVALESDTAPQLQYSLKRIGLNRKVRVALERRGLRTMEDALAYTSGELITMLHDEIPEKLYLLDTRLAHYGARRIRDVSLEASYGYLVELQY